MSKLTGKGERRLVREIIAGLDPGGARQLGDDCAMLEMGDDYIVATTDMMTASTHIPEGAAPEDVGWYAAAINLSDIAAMGAKPLGMLFALGLPRDTETEWLDGLMSGMRECCEAHSAPILGGDTKENPNITISGTGFGMVPKKAVLRRGGAKPGDLLAMTGALGRGILWERKGKDAALLLRVEPRVEAGMSLAASGICTSCIDISDGLSTCLHLMSAAGGVGFSVDAGKISLMKGLERNDLEKALHWGGDFELLFTVKRGSEAKLAGLLPEARVIGEVTKGPDIMLVAGGKSESLPDKGYEHFGRGG